MQSFVTLTLPSDYFGKRFIAKGERSPDRRGIYRRLAQDGNLFLTRLRQKHPDLSFIRVIERNLSNKLPLYSHGHIRQNINICRKRTLAFHHWRNCP